MFIMNANTTKLNNKILGVSLIFVHFFFVKNKMVFFSNNMVKLSLCREGSHLA